MSSPSVLWLHPEAVAYSAPERTERDLPHSLKTKNTIVLTFPKYVSENDTLLLFRCREYQLKKDSSEYQTPKTADK